MSSNIVDINTSGWRSVRDFYSEVLKRLGAPDWHGRNVNALVDSMIYGGLNTLDPPYVVRLHETSGLSDDIAAELKFVQKAIADARREQQSTTGIDADVRFELI